MRFGIGNLACAFAVALLLAGCNDQNEQTMLAEAKVALDKGDFIAATVYIKSALQKAPESAQARFLFGRVLLESGNLGAAEGELRKAQKLNYPTDELAPLLARILLVRQQYAQVIAEYANVKVNDTTRQADLSAVIAAAYEYSGQRAKATALVETTVASAPDNLPIRLIQARLMAQQGDVEGALTLVDQLATKSPKNIDTWRLLGDLFLYGKQNRSQALAAYRKILELSPGDVAAHTQVIGIHFSDKDLKAAKQQYDALAKAAPKQAQTVYYGAAFALLNGDFVRARELLAPLIELTKDDPKVLLLAATADFHLNSLIAAEERLYKVLGSTPNSVGARHLLATISLRRGDSAKALEILRPLFDGPTPDLESLTLAAEAHLLGGDAKKAEDFFARVIQLKPDDVQARTALAVAQMAKGDMASGLSELQTIAASDKGILADMILIDTRLRQNDFESALKAVDALDLKMPEKALPADLRGRIQLLKRDREGARANFEKALAKDPVYFRSVAALAELDIADRRPDAARQRFDSLLKSDPKNVQALMALAALRSSQNAGADEVAQLLVRAVEVNLNNPTARLQLIEHWLSSRRPKQAIEAAQAGLSAIPGDASLLDALGRAQLANNEVAQALNTFGKLAVLQPKSAFAQLRLADANLQANNLNLAEKAYRKALEISPDSVVAQSGLLTFAVRTKQPEKALQVARSVQRQRPKDEIGYLLEGDAYAAFKDWDSAAKAFRTGLQKQGTGLAALRLYAALEAAKRKPEADRFAEDWIMQSPKETRLRSYLAEQAMNAGDLPKAERLYREIVALDPRELRATNNLAWILAKTGKPEAVAMAERAVALAPTNASVLDTLGFALVEVKQFDRAIEASSAAVRLAPDSPLLRLNLAKIYVKANDKKRAKAELEELTRFGAQFAARKDVVELRMALSDQP